MGRGQGLCIKVGLVFVHKFDEGRETGRVRSRGDKHEPRDLAIGMISLSKDLFIMFHCP